MFNLVSTCILPASIRKPASHACRTEQPSAKFCSSCTCLCSELTPAISQGDCTNVEVSYSYFLILPGHKWTTFNLSAWRPSAVWPHDSQVWQARQRHTSSSPLTRTWQQELISQVRKENQLKNPSDCFALVCRYLVPINITVRHAHVSKRNTPLAHFVMSQCLESGHRLHSCRSSIQLLEIFFF